MTIIKDGAGKGFLAKVGHHNDLHVISVCFSALHNASEDNRAFQAEGEATILASGSGEQTVLVLINNGDTALEIGNIFISVKTESDATKITIVKIYLGSVTASGGTSKSTINLNTGSVATADVTVRENAPTITGTDTKILELYFQAGNGNNVTIPFDGGIILKRNGSFRVGVTGAAAVTAGLMCDASFQFWEEGDL